MTTRAISQPYRLTVDQSKDILRTAPHLSNKELFARLGRDATSQAAVARRELREEWERDATAIQAPVQQSIAIAPTTDLDAAVDAAVDALASAVAARGQHIIAVTLGRTITHLETETLTPRGGAS